MAKHQLQQHEAGLNRLAEANVVRDEQVDARHLDRANDRIELIALDLDAAAERRLELTGIGDRGGAPSDRVEEGLEVRRLIETFRFGQRHLLEGVRSRLDLPD